jgi:hypothetical protein
MGLAPSGNGENPGKSAVAKVPVPIFSQPRSAATKRAGFKDVYGSRSSPPYSSWQRLQLTVIARKASRAAA